MKNLITLLFTTFCAFSAAGQNLTQPQATSELSPDPGYSLGTYLSESINYPAHARDNAIQGTVILKFVVTETGRIDSIRVIKALYDSLDREAIRVVKRMPKWKPGRVNGQPVRTRFVLPVKFSCDAGKPDYVAPKKAISGPVHSYVDQMPSADFDIPEYIASQLSYFTNKEFAGVNGKVVLRFVITSEGDADSIRVLKSLDPSIDAVAVKFVEDMPLWIPGMQDGKAVNVYYTLPIAFKFSSDTMAAVSGVTADTSTVINDSIIAHNKRVKYELPKPTFNYGKYYSEQLQYPAYLLATGIQGPATVHFTIDQWGYVGSVSIISAAHSMFGQELARWVKDMPRWIPAQRDGKPVKYEATITINFVQSGSSYQSKSNVFQN